ncbi:hypothetical protein SDC9_193775 [bioreactor metagenome]|uniref:DNA/pantothenate metabolism flavoprotein C-terminal domain-containing protein n=1 Tax=bioreactor metagenome TaxID=1076179 RepID=A0A645I5X7_9ZZZZ
MLDAAVGAFPVVDAAILSAAVADFRPTLQWQEKIKRNDRDELILTLTANPDIAASLGLMKESHQTLVGFALETNDEEQNALKKLGKKNLDFIVLNSMRDEGAGFGGDTNKVTILSRDGNKISFGLKSKKEVAKDIIDTVFETSSIHSTDNNSTKTG